MPFDGNGNYSLPTPAYPAVAGATITAANRNTVDVDLANALSNCLTRDGQSPPTANLPMGTRKLTQLAEGTTAGDSLRFEQLFGGGPGTAEAARAHLGVPSTADTNALVPAGTVIYYSGTAAPTGYLKANGATVSRTTYAALFAAIGTTYGAGDGSTTFKLPDLRGEFLRGWDDGRGIDAARALGSFQDSTNRSHSHGVNDPGHGHGVSDPGHSHSGGEYTGQNFIGGSSGAFVRLNINAGNNTGAAATGISIVASGSNISINADGSSEARPRNIALLACIKY